MNPAKAACNNKLGTWDTFWESYLSSLQDDLKLLEGVDSDNASDLEFNETDQQSLSHEEVGIVILLLE